MAEGRQRDPQVVLTTTRGLAASTSRTVFNTVNAVFRAAVRDRMIPHNPCAEAKLPSVPRKKIVPLAVEQVRTLSDETACTSARPRPLARTARSRSLAWRWMR